MSTAIRVLHVDDNPEFTELTAEFIDREFDAFEIIQALDAEEGLIQLAEEPIDCVVSDYKLPGRDGIEFLEEVRETEPELPFILFTGKGSEAVASEAISAGATDYFRKERIENQYDLLANRILNAVSATEARERVEERTREYQTLVEEAPIPMLVVDRTHEIRFVNSRAVETFGAESETDLAGESAERFLPESDQDAIDRLGTVLQDGVPVEVTEYEFTDVDGNSRYGRGTIVPVTFEGEPAAQVVTTDITERRRQEERARRRQEQITQLHEIGVDIAGCECKQEVYDLMVDAAERILDLDLCIVDSVDDGMLVVEATSSELSEYEEAPIEEGGLAGKAHQTGESTLVYDSSEHPDADPVGEFQSSITVPIDEFGVFQAAARETGAFDERDLELVEILVGHASEALVRLEQQEQLREHRDKLQRENERLDQFASIVSHDIRNPLNVAQLRLDLAMDECESDHLDAVARSVERIETLTDELLDLARMGDTITEFVPVELGTVVRGCWQNVETAGATVRVPDDGRIQADETRLQQLLENLLRNAVEHGSTGPASQTQQDAAEHDSTIPDSHARQDAGSATASEPSIADAPEDREAQSASSSRTQSDDRATSKTSQADGEAVDAVEHGGDGVTVTVDFLDDGDGFYVEDDGRGMDEEVRRQAFDSGFSTREGGTGFGLAIVSRAAEAHGWEVRVTESEAGGARFEFTGVDVL